MSTGQRVLIAKAGTDGVLLEVWGGGRLLKELQVSGPCDFRVSRSSPLYCSLRVTSAPLVS
jgi:hypothetical protein